MTLADKIKKIRQFRGLTQKQLGMGIGFHEKNADSRIRQYEIEGRIPRDGYLMKIAEILSINPINFTGGEPGSAEYIMQNFFWLEETSPGLVRLFPLEKNKGKVNSSPDSSVKYWDSDAWPAHSPTGIWINNKLVDGFLREWLIRKDELKVGSITKDEYFEWKLNWPRTCDDCGRIEPIYKWRSADKGGDDGAKT
jgi:transcriptional regulator with XRE-family HTH domain